MPVTWDLPPASVILLGMDTSPVSPDDIRAAAEVHEELGPEYHDAVVASFVDRVEREVDARVRARLAAMHRADVVVHRAEVAPLRRGTLLKGMALGAGAGALIALAATGLGTAHPGVHLPHFRSHQLPGTIHVLPVIIHGKPGTGFPPPAMRRITVSPPKS
jgi:hypothetical protein